MRKNNVWQNNLSDYDMLNQLNDLIADRESFLSNNDDLDNPFQRDIDALKKIIYDYKIYKDAAFRSMEENGQSLGIWNNENVRLRKAKILNKWVTDYGDVRCHVILYKKNKPVANIIVSYDLKYIENLSYEMYGSSRVPEKFADNPYKILIYQSFDNYLRLPKISKCSPLLREIYDCVCKSESSMCYITEEDWEEEYSERFTEQDFKNLKDEVNNLGLEDVIEFNGEYKILGYTDLETRFNDNRKLVKSREYEK